MEGWLERALVAMVSFCMSWSSELDLPETVDSTSVKLAALGSDLLSEFKRWCWKLTPLLYCNVSLRDKIGALIYLAFNYCSNSHAALSNSSSSASARLSLEVNLEWKREKSFWPSRWILFLFAWLTRARELINIAAVVNIITTTFLFLLSNK